MNPVYRASDAHTDDSAQGAKERQIVGTHIYADGVSRNCTQDQSNSRSYSQPKTAVSDHSPTPERGFAANVPSIA
jgi:hypothetical protein